MRELTCPVCGKVFESNHSLAKYCSRKCYKAAARTRMSADLRPEHVKDARRALLAVGDGQRERIREMMRGALG
jgi:tRNA(Glu) U13 pseudouridine synthase TruD